VIFVDSNLFVIDLRYPRDPAHDVNRKALERLARDRTGVTSVLNLLEVCGILSFNLSASALEALYVHFERRYGVKVLPAASDEARLPAPGARDVLAKMKGGMALKDAEIALVADQHAATLSVFLSWNAKHFAGRVPVPALTPRQWLAQLRRANQT
jgi:predicted nucleic acid-binding protein